jgi:hypothetical protein
VDYFEEEVRISKKCGQGSAKPSFVIDIWRDDRRNQFLKEGVY